MLVMRECAWWIGISDYLLSWNRLPGLIAAPTYRMTADVARDPGCRGETPSAFGCHHLATGELATSVRLKTLTDNWNPRRHS